jgi:hypothetical protein
VNQAAATAATQAAGADWTSFIGPAVVAAVVAAIISLVVAFINRGTTIKLHKERLDQEDALAKKKADADIALAERKFELDASLADRKRRQDLAEEVLSGFYQVAAIMRSVRSPMSYEGEGKDRPKVAGETESMGRLKDTYYAIIARYEHNREAIGNLMSKRHRMAAWFGAAADAPFQELLEAINLVIIGAQSLIRYAGDENGVRKTNLNLWHKWEGSIWWGAEDPDPIATKIDAATKKIEDICKPVLQAKAS